MSQVINRQTASVFHVSKWKENVIYFFKYKGYTLYSIPTCRIWKMKNNYTIYFQFITKFIKLRSKVNFISSNEILHILLQTSGSAKRIKILSCETFLPLLIEELKTLKIPSHFPRFTEQTQHTPRNSATQQKTIKQPDNTYTQLAQNLGLFATK